MVGTTQRILVERLSRNSFTEIAGRTENNRVVNVEGSPDLIGQFIDVKITEAYTNSLKGEIVATPEADKYETQQFHAL
ncbi:hypothetical protein THIOSC15_1560006 [uncultured Thiomicrorhabdus sp.]